MPSPRWVTGTILVSPKCSRRQVVHGLLTGHTQVLGLQEGMGLARGDPPGGSGTKLTPSGFQMAEPLSQPPQASANGAAARLWENQISSGCPKTSLALQCPERIQASLLGLRGFSSAAPLTPALSSALCLCQPDPSAWDAHPLLSSKMSRALAPRLTLPESRTSPAFPTPSQGHLLPCSETLRSPTTPPPTP